MKLRLPTLVASLTIAASSLVGMQPAAADTLDIAPPGANNWSCKPSTEHPYPVILVPGTFESMAKNWATLSPILADAGYCVFSLNYGTTNGVHATGPVTDSAAELGDFVDAVLAATNAKKADLVGHSQGGMMPRYYMGFLGGAKKVNHLIGIAPSNHGTSNNLTSQSSETSTAEEPTSENQESGSISLCQACTDQGAGSPFMQELNSIGDIVTGPSYTVISTKYDEIVTPYQSQYLAGPARQVTNVTIQDKCPLDLFEHDQLPNDPAVQQLVLHALDQIGAPANPLYQPRCL
ncbi:lipase family alpha/beta hydrolase [Arthrobacter sp. TmT3-37]